MLISIKRVPRLAHEDGRIRFQLERDDHALGRPPLDQVLQELGHRVQVYDQTLASGHCWGRIEIVKGLLLVGRRTSARARTPLDRIGSVCALDLVF